MDNGAKGVESGRQSVLPIVRGDFPNLMGFKQRPENFSRTPLVQESNIRGKGYESSPPPAMPSIRRCR